jgi:hypothetical protein
MNPLKTVFARLSLLIVFSVFVLAAVSGRADEGGGGGRGGGDRGGGGDWRHRGPIQWTLADWLAEKDQFRVEDQWLALHQTAGFFAFGVGGGSESYSLSANSKTSSQNDTVIDANLFFSIFGLDYTYESSDENWTRQSGALHLRLFGTHARSTYFNIAGGERAWSFASNATTNSSGSSISVTNPFVEAKLNLYIFKFFGIEGQYDYYMSASANDNSKWSGNTVQYGAFFEFWILRLGAKEILETDYTTPAGGGAQATQTRNGTLLEVGFFL